MDSYLGVVAASANPPHFIHLCYKPPNGEVKTKLALVGKGLNFDSRGYNIKTGAGSMIEQDSKMKDYLVDMQDSIENVQHEVWSKSGGIKFIICVLLCGYMTRFLCWN